MTLEQQIRALVAEGRSDPEIAEALGMTRDTVRGWRRRWGIPPGVPPGGSSLATGWELRLQAAWAEGLTVPELAERMEWTTRTVQQRLHELGLSARAPRE